MSSYLSDEQIRSLEEEADRNGVGDIYAEIVKRGTGPRMALMLALQQFPGLKGGDTIFSRRENDRMKSMDEEQREAIIKIAKRAGINVANRSYNGQLGKYDDPAAWVSDTSDVIAAAKKNGLSLGGEGMIKYDHPHKPKKKTRIAADILDRLERNARAADPSLNAKCAKSEKARGDLRHKLTEKHSKPKKD